MPSDRLMEVLLKADDPDKFAERTKNEHSAAPPLIEALLQLEARIQPQQPEAPAEPS